MAKAKHQKTRPNKQPHRKRRGKETDISELRVQLDTLGLKIIQVTADGNCFFRALADQLEGNEDEHEKYRSMVVRFIKSNREMFEPFVEDDIPFDEYCRTMGQEGNWAGHMELQAASLVTHSNICIHRHMSPRWYTQNFDILEARMIHLSYHDGEHYNSVRLKDDTCCGPARPIVIKGDADLSAMLDRAKITSSEQEGGGDVLQEESVKMINAGSGRKDSTKVEQAGGEVDAELLIAEQGSGDHIVAVDEHCHLTVNFSSDEREDMNCEQHKLKVQDKTVKHYLSGDDVERVHNKNLSGDDVERVHNKNSPQPDEKKIFKNKACPCGSKKKYKSCCGSVVGKPSARFPVNQTIDCRKSRKDRKQGRKAALTVANSIESNGGPPDMGALCI